MSRRRSSAFTLIELLIATAVSVVLSGIIYTVGSEALISFARNISINRSYTDARLSLERIGSAAQTAGHTPVLIDSAGLITSATPAAGIRFYRYGLTPTYLIPSGSSSAKTLTITVATGQAVPVMGDLVVISQIGYQGTISAAVTCSAASGTTNNGSATTATLTFASTITSGCVPALSADKDFTVKAGSPAASPPVAGTAYSCQVYSQVAFIAVPPASGTSGGSTQLRYYRRAMSASTSGTACGGLSAYNSATAFDNPANFKVIASLPINGTAAQISPFSLPGANAPTVNVILCAEGPDYNKRNLHTANTFSQVQSSLGPRCPLLLRGPF